MTTAWHELQHEPISWEMFLDIDEDVRRDLEIVDGYVVPRDQRSRDHQKVATRLSPAFETAAAPLRPSPLCADNAHYVKLRFCSTHPSTYAPGR